MREGQTQVDEDFQIPDLQINILFLQKLKSQPQWNDWATDMLRDGRLNAPNPANRMTFKELAELAIRHETVMRQKKNAIQHARSKPTSHPSFDGPSNSEARTQEEINMFVVQQMRRDENAPCRNESVKRYGKNPSQGEINEYVIQQMRREQRITRVRSQSQPEPRAQTKARSTLTRCTFCGDSYHQYDNCWRRFRVAVEVPHGNFMPKHVEFRTEMSGQPPVYRSGFGLV
ncbi:hypothetical protein BDV28DRAFT_138059 [Aspergillus coremiiformis]|uniref:Uncharacterized protein n=1 Tax=Aspergillus coremiiformis TaxID=138285 RepID=A0A5N6YZZ6_9EURO|nr:hypothetical protein BDV28DRAFT_138059 [Aspergillus coremiiformis]